jgi:predicted GH43/DUF377 family glycosyl hydrolase
MRFFGPLALLVLSQWAYAQDLSAYLMVYFKDDTHDLYFALSNDGYSFTDVNDGKPVIVGDTLAEQKGIRDPYILRAPDGTFYMALTDLHIYGQKDGFRETEWDRDGKKYGWGNNRGLVLMKSNDLLHWSHTVLRVDQSFPGFGDIGCAWAPELYYDPQTKKIMIYFSIRFGNEKEKVYYSFMNDDFTKLASPPKVLFNYPDPGVGYIDADITKYNNKYYLFYSVNRSVKRMVSDSLTSGYQYEEKRYDSETVACEAPNVFRRIKDNKWVLVYDIYGIKPHNFGFRETSDFVTFKDLGRFNEGVMKSTNFSSPKHPSVILITKEEAKRIATKWKLNMTF